MVIVAHLKSIMKAVMAPGHCTKDCPHSNEHRLQESEQYPARTG